MQFTGMPHHNHQPQRRTLISPIDAVDSVLGDTRTVCGVDCGVRGVEVVGWGEEGGCTGFCAAY